MLALADLVVGRLDLEPHVLQGGDHGTARLVAQVDGREVEVAAFVFCLRRRTAFRVPLEQIELGLGPGVHDETGGLGLLDDALQVAARVAGERLAAGQVDVADEPGDVAVLALPGDEGKRVEVRLQVHVGLLDADEALDGGPVEHDVAVQRLFQLFDRQGHVLGRAEDIGELELDKFDFELLGLLENSVLRHFTHRQLVGV